MGKAAIRPDPDRQGSTQIIDAESILNALDMAVFVINGDNRFLKANIAAEHFFKNSAQALKNLGLDDYFLPDNPIFPVIHQVRSHGHAVTEYDVTLQSARIDLRRMNIQASPIPWPSELIVITLQDRSITEKINRQLSHKGAARSVSAMATMLAHEIKNPLSGIRGAAQLLEQNTSEQDQGLTQLICDETDRICALVDRFGVFSEDSPMMRDSVNIHQVLDRVHKLAKNGFGKHLKYHLIFDPSLPPVLGNRDQLVQLFLNLVKNAAEAAPSEGGEITLRTSFQHGVRFTVPGCKSPVLLPLRVTVEDNGKGVPDELSDCLFDPFVTSKQQGSGLGLALVAKIVDDHGAMIELDRRQPGAVFHISLPVTTVQTGDGTI